MPPVVLAAAVAVGESGTEAEVGSTGPDRETGTGEEEEREAQLILHLKGEEIMIDHQAAKSVGAIGLLLRVSTM